MNINEYFNRAIRKNPLMLKFIKNEGLYLKFMTKLMGAPINKCRIKETGLV